MWSHRPLTKSDLEQISSFPSTPEELFYMSPSASFPLTPEQIERLLEGRIEPTVVLGLDGVVGYANLYGMNQAEQVCWLGNVVVAPEARGSGASTYLLATMCAKAHELGYARLFLSCHNTNDRALRFYYKYGFKPADLRVGLRENGESFITFTMVKNLREAVRDE